MGHRCRAATPEDLPVLLVLAEAFVSECSLGYRFDAGRAEQAFLLHMVEPNADVLVVKSAQSIAGAAIVAIEDHFGAEPVGHIVNFHVLRDPWCAGAGPVLLDACVRWFDRRGCVDCWVTALSGFGPSSGLTALLVDAGFSPGGSHFRRRQGGHPIAAAP